MTLFLQLEASLADARAELEKAGEALHDAAVKAAQYKAEYDAQAETLRRLEGALRALHGDLSGSPTPGMAGALAQGSGPAREKAPRKPKAEGPACPGCAEIGTLARQGPLIVCTACQHQIVA